MTEIIFFGLGYLFARIIQQKLVADLLLYWDKDCFGWRPVIPGSKIRQDLRYLAAFEIGTDEVVVKKGDG